MTLQTFNQFDIGTDLGQLGRGFQQGQQIAGQFELSQQRRDAAKRATDVSTQQNTKFDQDQSVLRGQVLVRLLTTLKTIPLEQRDAFVENQAGELEKFNIDVSVFRGQPKDDASLDEAIAGAQIATPTQAPPSQFEQAKTAKVIAETGQIGKVAPVVTSTLDQARINKLNAETAALGKGKTTETPALDALVAGASPELQQRSKAAFQLAGGGDKGVKALQKVLEGGVESERRAAAPQTLKANFPQADEAELSELQAVVDSAKTTESGFKSADKLREKQRQTKKGRVFQTRAVELLDRILDNPELDDVIGSREGADKSIIPFVSGTTFRSDVEADAVADIDEVRNILTAGNLGIMSGVLSETDIKIIADLAGGALNRTRTEESFIRDVTALRERVAGEFGILPKGVTEDDISTTMEVRNLTRAQVLDRLRRK